MTVSDIPVINSWSGNGTNKEFDFDFRINKQSELIIETSSKMISPGNVQNFLHSGNSSRCSSAYSNVKKSDSLFFIINPTILHNG